MKRLFSLILIVLILGFAMLVGSQNDTVVSVNYLIAKSDIRLSTLIAITLGLGAVIGCLIMMTSWLALRVKVISLNAKLKKLSKEN